MKTPSRFSRLFVAVVITISLPQSSFAGGASAMADAAKSVAMTTVMSSVLTGTALQVPCTSGTNPAACVMMGLAFAQAVSSMGAAKQSQKSASDLSSNLRTGGGSATSPAAPSNGYQNNSTGDRNADLTALTSLGLGSLAGDFQNLKNAVAQSGVSVSADGSKATLANGKTVATSSLGSADAMKKAGFSDSDIAGVKDALADASTKIDSSKSKIASMTNDQGGGGGGGGMGSSDTGGTGGGGGSAFGGFGRGRGAGGKEDNGVAGMSKKLGSDSIGVAGDNIFEMVTRRYQARDKADAFLKK